MQKVSIEKINHRGEQRIQVNLAFTEQNRTQIKTITGRRWSQTRKKWHIPYTNEAYKELIDVFGAVTIIAPTDQDNIHKKQAISVPATTVDRRIVRTNLPPPSSQITQEKKQFPVVQTTASSKYITDRYIQHIQDKTIFTGRHCILHKLNDDFLACYVPAKQYKWRTAVKSIPGNRWIADKAYWQVPYVEETLVVLHKYIPSELLEINFIIGDKIAKFHPISHKNLQTKHTFYSTSYRKKPKREDIPLNPAQQEAFTLLKEALLLRRYSYSTIKGYGANFKYFMQFHKNILPTDLQVVHLQEYLIHQIKFRKISESTQNQIINAVKYYWENILKREREHVEIQRPKKRKKLPNVLSKEEVARLIASPQNIKHKLILLLLYSSGLRRSEILKLRIRDINIDRNQLFIKAGKGKKDRYVVLAKTVVPYLLKYKKIHKPNYWLFEGFYGGQYSATSIQKIFRRAQEDSGINSYATIHTLRHSYATHCVEAGYSLKMVQESLGHGSLKTTEIYLHIASDVLQQMKSPLDSLDFS